MRKTLLQRAQKQPVGKVRGLRARLNGEQLEDLVLAWLKGEVSYTQAAHVTNSQGAAYYGLAAVSLKRAYLRGRIEIV